MNGETTNLYPIKHSRIQILYKEFSDAVGDTSSSDLKDWGKKSIEHLGKITVRRGKGLVRSFTALMKFTANEANLLLKATKDKELKKHLSNRGKLVLSAIDKTYKSVLTLITYLKDDPRKAAPQVFFGFIGFLVGSGGFDADGGIPDMDLVIGGIGSHRSIWTHSILPAIAIEAMAFSLVKLVEIIHDKLPKQHDVFWDKLKSHSKEIANAFAKGACAGIAYHLLCDANITAARIKPYSDLPVDLPMLGHQVILLGGGIIEIVDLKGKVMTHVSKDGNNYHIGIIQNKGLVIYDRFLQQGRIKRNDVKLFLVNQKKVATYVKSIVKKNFVPVAEYLRQEHLSKEEWIKQIQSSVDVYCKHLESI